MAWNRLLLLTETTKLFFQRKIYRKYRRCACPVICMIWMNSRRNASFQIPCARASSGSRVYNFAFRCPCKECISGSFRVEVFPVLLRLLPFRTTVVNLRNNFFLWRFHLKFRNELPESFRTKTKTSLKCLQTRLLKFLDQEDNYVDVNADQKLQISVVWLANVKLFLI